MDIDKVEDIPQHVGIKCCHCEAYIGQMSKCTDGISVNSEIGNVVFRFTNNNIKIQCTCKKCFQATSVTIENGNMFKLKIKENKWSL